MILNRVLDENQLSLQPTSTLPHLTSNQSSTANGRHHALSALTAGHRPLRRAARPLIILIYLCRANEGWQTRWEKKVWGSSLTSPVITHSPLLSPLQTLLSNWTGHGQLWHMPEQRMHYLQVSGHYSSKTPWSKCGPFFLLEGWKKRRGGERWRGCKTNVDAVNEHSGTGDIYTSYSLWIYASLSDSPIVTSHRSLHCELPSRCSVSQTQRQKATWLKRKGGGT